MYTIRKEFCGYHHENLPKGFKQGQALVVRHCGEWIGKSTTQEGAKRIKYKHKYRLVDIEHIETISNILSYDDKDEDEKIEEVKQYIKKLL